jgi:hypothetical protein
VAIRRDKDIPAVLDPFKDASAKISEINIHLFIRQKLKDGTTELRIVVTRAPSYVASDALGLGDQLLEHQFRDECDRFRSSIGISATKRASTVFWLILAAEFGHCPVF